MLVERWIGREAGIRSHLVGLLVVIGVRVIRIWVTCWLLTSAIASARFLKLMSLFLRGS